MADQIYPQNGIQSGRSAQPGLEAAPSRYSTAPIAYDPSEMQSPGEKSTWTSSQAYPVYTAPPGRRRILGLTVPVFWGLVAALAVILAGGIAGGVAGGLTALKANNSSTQSHCVNLGFQHFFVTELGHSRVSGDADSIRGKLRPRFQLQVLRINRNIVHISLGAHWRPLRPHRRRLPQHQPDRLHTHQRQRRRDEGRLRLGPILPTALRGQLPSGARYGNPELYDILKVYVPTFEECMALCASYNQGYSNNLANGNVASRGYCRSVAMIKLPGEYCYLKNGTGKMDTQGHPKDFISAVVISGLPDL
ncbi:hypothetical protein Ct61P_09863 [Colletotrichum tofieldiae]|nr:hypothetical protein Ct61P_09863 [Colletotrichum tofieldiae]